MLGRLSQPPVQPVVCGRFWASCFSTIVPCTSGNVFDCHRSRLRYAVGLFGNSSQFGGSATSTLLVCLHGFDAAPFERLLWNRSNSTRPVVPRRLTLYALDVVLSGIMRHIVLAAPHKDLAMNNCWASMPMPDMSSDFTEASATRGSEYDEPFSMDHHSSPCDTELTQIADTTGGGRNGKFSMSSPNIDTASFFCLFRSPSINFLN